MGEWWKLRGLISLGSHSELGGGSQQLFDCLWTQAGDFIRFQSIIWLGKQLVRLHGMTVQRPRRSTKGRATTRFRTGSVAVGQLIRSGQGQKAAAPVVIRAFFQTQPIQYSGH